MKKKRGARGCYKKKKHKLPRYQNEDVADRAAFMLDRSLEDQASTYELIEAKKKQQEYKVKLYQYFMKYGKNMSKKVSKYSIKNGYYDYNT